VKTRLVKWGNSVGLRIPKAFTEAAKPRPGDPLEMAVEGSGPVRIRKKKDKKLGQLLRGITPGNLHGEIDWGKPPDRTALPYLKFSDKCRSHNLTQVSATARLASACKHRRGNFLSS
jgi:antitoxin MazE